MAPEESVSGMKRDADVEAGYVNNSSGFLYYLQSQLVQQRCCNDEIENDSYDVPGNLSDNINNSYKNSYGDNSDDDNVGYSGDDDCNGGGDSLKMVSSAVLIM